MSEQLQHTIQQQILVLSEEEQREVLTFVNGIRSKKAAAQTLGGLIDECFKSVPADVMDELPEDAALNLDHYLYRSLKK